MSINLTYYLDVSGLFHMTYEALNLLFRKYQFFEISLKIPSSLHRLYLQDHSWIRKKRVPFHIIFKNVLDIKFPVQYNLASNNLKPQYNEITK